VEGITAPPEEVGPMVRQHSLAAIRSSPGLQAAYNLRDERDPSRAATVTLFDTRGHAAGAHDRAVSVMRRRMAMVVPGPPRIVALGRTVVMASAQGGLGARGTARPEPGTATPPGRGRAACGS
jgi:hypothetical protein